MEKALDRKSLRRSVAWFGADRRFISLLGLLTGLTFIFMLRGLGLFYGLTILIPSSLLLGGVWIARRLYKADPMLWDVFQKSRQYAKYYPPKPDQDAMHPVVRDFV